MSSFTILWASYNSGKAATFNLSNGTATTVGATVSATITSVGNGWYRCTTTDTSANYIVLFSLNNATNTPISVGSYIYLWGAQAEAGSYATSYIPTIAAAVTRGADSASKTGITSLIGQTEGTLFLEFNTDNTDLYKRLSISDGTTTNWIFIGVELGTGYVRGYVRTGGVNTADINGSVNITGASAKIAIAYKANDVAVYANGNQVGTDNTATIPTCSWLDLASQNPSTAVNAASEINQALLFKTRLTNAQLAELTTL